MLKKRQTLILGSLLGSIFGAVWGVRGVAEFKLRLQADFNSGFHTPCTPGRGAAEKFHATMDAKSEPKTDVWAIRGPTFEVLGHVFGQAFF